MKADWPLRLLLGDELQIVKSNTTPWFFDRNLDQHLILLEKGADAQSIKVINSALAQIITTFPANAMRFVLIDPEHQGGSFNLFSQLGDTNPDLIGQRIQYEPEAIGKALRGVSKSIAEIKQNKLRGNYRSLDEYNTAFEAAAGAADQAYRFIAIANFPRGFTPEACNELRKILINGPSCGVHVFLHWDQSHDLPYGVSERELTKPTAAIFHIGSGYTPKSIPSLSRFGRDATDHLTYRADNAPSNEIVSDSALRLFAGIERANSVALNIDDMLADIGRETLPQTTPMPKVWTESSGESLRIPIGNAGANRIFEFAFGVDTLHHGIIVGGIGSGKSNLLHTIVQGTTHLYSPDELQLYLIDGKQAEFSSYADTLPHAKVVALASDPELAWSVLDELNQEMERRNNLFGDHGGKISTYREITGEKLPRILFIFDEFQTMFSGQVSMVMQAKKKLDSLILRGRSAGIHVILATQTMGDINFSDGVLQSIGARMVLKNAEREWPKILHPENTAPETLNRPGQAVVNDREGIVDGNHTLQVALANGLEELEQRLSRLRALSNKRKLKRQDLWGQRFVFAGKSAADASSLSSLNGAAGVTNPLVASADGEVSFSLLAGSPIALRDGEYLPLRRQFGGNFLAIDKSKSAFFGMFTVMLADVLFRSPPGMSIDIVMSNSISGAFESHSSLQWLLSKFPDVIQTFGDTDVEFLIDSLSQGVSETDWGEPSHSKLVVLLGIDKMRALHSMDDPFSDEDSTGMKLRNLLERGPEKGIHCMVWCDTLRTFERAFEDSALEFFETGIIAQQNRLNDSMKLVGDESATSLKPHRMLAIDKASSQRFRQVRMFEDPGHEWLSEQLKRKKR